ncbi:MAG: DUF2935 domain-containing protein [Bacilli bacterium]|nr:DUF2935 domain-containing protein [Bacilli bacterium]
MLTNKEFFLESMIYNLYYLWSLREYSARIEVSLPPIYQDYINKSNELAKRAENLNKQVADFAYKDGLPENVIESGIVITPYTLELELLTEKLFGIEIDETITEKEKMIVPKEVNPTDDEVKQMEQINEQALILSKDFINYANDLYEKIKNQQVFAFYYNTINLYLIEEAKLYMSNLNRLKVKATINPSYVIDEQYFGTQGMQAIATFIRGEIDPMYKDIFDEANNFVIEYRNILTEYDNIIMTPQNQKNMTLNSLELALRLKTFIEKCIQKLLNKEIYFISAPITKDNELTAINFFIFNLREIVLASIDNI